MISPAIQGQAVEPAAGLVFAGQLVPLERFVRLQSRYRFYAHDGRTDLPLAPPRPGAGRQLRARTRRLNMIGRKLDVSEILAPGFPVGPRDIT